jgi:hypothetical protein
MIQLIALLIAAASPAENPSAACRGADPAITNVVPAQTTNNDVNRYTLTIDVTNLGPQGQKANVLQSVDIVLDGTKNGEKGIPPLAAGQKYSFGYDVLRAEDARPGSTRVRLHLVVHQPAGVAADCNTANDTFLVKI